MAIDPIEVLLVEDNPTDAELALHVLLRRVTSHALFHVHDGVEALEFLRGEGAFAGRDRNDPPKVVLLDLKLPRMSGLGVLREMKADPRLREIPVVMLTSSRQDRDLDEAYRLGVNSYIVKPVNYDDFAEAVAQVGAYWLRLNEVPPTPKPS